jgi:hypothetical protein
MAAIRCFAASSVRPANACTSKKQRRLDIFDTPYPLVLWRLCPQPAAAAGPAVMHGLAPGGAGETRVVHCLVAPGDLLTEKAP